MCIRNTRSLFTNLTECDLITPHMTNLLLSIGQTVSFRPSFVNTSCTCTGLWSRRRPPQTYRIPITLTFVNQAIHKSHVEAMRTSVITSNKTQANTCMTGHSHDCVHYIQLVNIEQQCLWAWYKSYREKTPTQFIQPCTNPLWFTLALSP